jgi:hypothetical protein
MNRLLNVARYQLVDRVNYVVLPWGVLAFAFLVNVVIAALVPKDPDGYYTGGLMALYIMLFVLGAVSITKFLPFALALGMSRRTYYLGTALLVGVLGAVYSLALTVLQVVEGATGGWGLSAHFFRVPWILGGPWYQTWVTSFVLLVLLFAYGMWYGLVYRRWSILGVVAYGAAQVLVALAVVAAVSLSGNWPAVGNFFASLSVLGLVGVLAALAVVMGLGGFATLRRVTV